jgi:hypothetical protein
MLLFLLDVILREGEGMPSVPTHDILFAISAAPQKRHRIFHQASVSITNLFRKF